MKKKYETFYTCPGCGQLVRAGTTRCDCGYVFEDVFKVSVFKVILGSLLFYFLISLFYGISYGICDLANHFLRQIGIVESIFNLPVIGMVIAGSLFLTAIFALFSFATTTTMLLFTKLSNRYLQTAKSIFGGSVLCLLSFLYNLIWNLVNHGGTSHYYILALVQSVYLLYIARKLLKDAEEERISSLASPAIPQDDDEIKKQYAQQRVDTFYAEIFSGQINPYSGRPILSEDDYHNYLCAKKKSQQTAETAAPDAKLSMGPSFNELVREQKLEQSKIHAMTKEAYAQYRVDKVCSELFSGQLNPYTKKPILCEADFREYQREHQARTKSR